MQQRDGPVERRLNVSAARVLEHDGADARGIAVQLVVLRESLRRHERDAGHHASDDKERTTQGCLLIHSTTKKRACALPAVFSRSAAVLYGRPFFTASAHACVAPGTVIRSLSAA